MGSKSKNNMKRFRANRANSLKKDDFKNYGFWTEVLSAIETCEQGKNLSWRNRALLYTRFCSRLPDFCERYGLGVADGYITAVHALVDSKKLEWFEQDAIKRIKDILQEIVNASLKLRSGLDAVQAFADRAVGSKYV